MISKELLGMGLGLWEVLITTRGFATPQFSIIPLGEPAGRMQLCFSSQWKPHRVICVSPAVYVSAYSRSPLLVIIPVN